MPTQLSGSDARAKISAFARIIEPASGSPLRPRHQGWLAAARLSGVVSLALACIPAAALPSFAEVRGHHAESEAWLLARDGRVLQRLRLDPAVRRYPWTPLEAVSPALLRSLLLSEDRRFYEHSGIDWNAVAASAWGNLWNSRTRGASTLTMQLAGLLEDHGRSGRRDVLDKVGQAATALELERRWKKDQILEAYLNLAAFRGELVGVAAMSWGLFGKGPDGLDSREAALAAALLRSPGARPDAVADRACGLLRLQQRADADCTGLDTLARLAFSGALRDAAPPPGSPVNLAPHLARKLLNRPGERLATTLDSDLQRFAAAALDRHLRELARHSVEDGALLAIDNQSGAILSWVGSSGDLSNASQVDAAVALRQAGSTLKPFLYGLALERRQLTAASLIDDSPAALATAGGLYVPQNYSPDYRGWVSARLALGQSLNVPAVRTLVRLGTEPFFDRLRGLGFASLKEGGDYYGYSLALGSADVSLLMLANAYRSLANGGRWTPLRADPRGERTPCREGGCAGVFVGPPRRASTPAAAFVVADILADRSARAGTFGLDSWLATPYWSAAKTGTSKDMRDNWCVGFSRRYTVAVWVGNASGNPMHDVSGTSGAAPVWREVMDWLHRGDATGARPTAVSRAPEPPAGLVHRPVRCDPPREPPRQAWFLTGTEMVVVREAGATRLARIAYPGDGSVLALDPDIPPGRQRVSLQLSGPAGPGWRWQVDAATPMRADRPALWLPSPGSHSIRLVDATGLELDKVVVQVRALRGKRR